mmetsp:Transcript_14972/g.37353  ORF Transcript_14972/g.37353 Transcript_14972/m.37353 type:complete len:118 (-) Transcript_14972:165-518(-)
MGVEGRSREDEGGGAALLHHCCHPALLLAQNPPPWMQAAAMHMAVGDHTPKGAVGKGSHHMGDGGEEGRAANPLRPAAGAAVTVGDRGEGGARKGEEGTGKVGMDTHSAEEVLLLKL